MIACTGRPLLPESLRKAERDAHRRVKELEKQGADKLAIDEAKTETYRLFRECFFNHERDWNATLNHGVTWESTLLGFFKGDDHKKIPQELGDLDTTQEGLATKPMES
jgi:hypothetical protein